MQEVELSVILPVYDEAEVIHLVYRRLKAVISLMGISHELLFVDDGSRDGTEDVLSHLAQDDSCVTIVFLTRHFGKESALMAGLAQSAGQAVIIMDADLQDPPELIPHMWSAWRDGADVVWMRRRIGPGQSRLEYYGAQCLNRMLDAASKADILDGDMDFMLYSRKAATTLGLVSYRKHHMKPMFIWMGFRQAEIDYARQPRAAGGSKLSLPKLLGISSSASSAYLYMLARILMGFGLAAVLSGLAYALYAVMEVAFLGRLPQDDALAAATRALLWGGLLYLLGSAGKCFLQTLPPKRCIAYSIRKLVRCRSNYS